MTGRRCPVADERRETGDGHGGCDRIPTHRCTSMAQWCDAEDGKTLAVINPADESVVGRGGLRRPGRGRAGDRGGGAGVPGVAGAVGLRPGQDPEEDRRADARAGRRDRPDPDPGAGQAAAPRPRPRCCTRPTPSSGSPRRGSGPTAGSSRRRTSPSGTTRSSTRSASSARSRPGTSRPRLPSRKIAPALAVGCTVVSRPAEQTPLTLIQMFECLADAGLPAGRRQPGDRPAAADRRRLLRAPGGPQDQLHRLDRGRQGADPALGRPGQAAEPRARRPCPADRLPRRRRRSRSPRRPSSASSATTARSASPRRGSTSTRRSPRSSPRRPSS